MNDDFVFCMDMEENRTKAGKWGDVTGHWRRMNGENVYYHDNAFFYRQFAFRSAQIVKGFLSDTDRGPSKQDSGILISTEGREERLKSHLKMHFYAAPITQSSRCQTRFSLPLTAHFLE